MTLASFLTFVLLVAALRDEEWVSGGLEYTPGNYSAVQRFQQGCSMCDSGLTATVRARCTPQCPTLRYLAHGVCAR